MEIPDVIVVNKADHPMTETMVREIRGVLSLAPQEGWRVPIIKTEAVHGRGIEELAEKLAEHRAYVTEAGTLAERRRRNLMAEVIGLATVRLRRALEASLREDPAVQGLPLLTRDYVTLLVATVLVPLVLVALGSLT